MVATEVINEINESNFEDLDQIVVMIDQRRITIMTIMDSFKLNPDQKKLLLKALRSGPYLQTSQRLRNDNKFCCLGVACDIFYKNAATHGERWTNQDLFISIADDKISIDEYELPVIVREYFGFQRADGKLPVKIQYNGRAYDSLARLNDAGMSFAEIADVIEKYL